MRTVTYQSVLDRISGYLGEDGGMSAEDAGLACRLVNLFYKLGLEYYFWPELMNVERRQFRPSWAVGTAYAAGTEVYYPPAQAYYQALTASTGQAPASGTDAVENSAYWALSQPCYSGQDWATGTAYIAGNIVRNPADQQFYQCFSPHTAGASLDMTQFGLLTDFIRSIDYEQDFLTPPNTGTATPLGEVKAIYCANPETTASPRPVDKQLRRDYVQVFGSAPVVWVEFRDRPNVFTNLAWAAGSFAPGAVRYYSVTGECYSCLAAATTEPPTDATKWGKLDFPYFLAELRGAERAHTAP